MGAIKKWLDESKTKNIVLCILYSNLRGLKRFFTKRFFSDKYLVEKNFYRVFGKKLNLLNPRTLNEKIQWLKLYDRTDLHTICADKYAVREYLRSEFGDEYLVPLVFETSNWRDVSEKNILSFPCIIKANHTSGDFTIIRDKESINWMQLQLSCRLWLKTNYYEKSQEWQYKNIKRKIIVEELLQTQEGKIPNDYKLHYINGQLEFVYVSVDREGVNKRNIYDKDWNALHFSWVDKAKSSSVVRGDEIDAPLTFSKMKEIGSKIAEKFRYVRVDFYDVDGRLYFGEITFHHGSGFDVFVPDENDLKYGNILKL